MYPTTVAYKHLEDGAPIYLDFHQPTTKADAENESGEHRIPAVIYFHAGGLHIGNRAALPPWLLRRVTALGCAVISVDYQLIPPASVHDIIQDIQDLFAFLAKETLSAGDRKYKIDENRIVVGGSSAGGYLAYLSAMHASPKPKGVFSVYSTGGNYLIPQYLQAKTKPFFMGRNLLDPSQFQDYIYPFSNGPIAPTSDIPFVIGIPPTSRRFAMAPLYLQLGTYLDFVTGQHEPSFSGALRTVLEDESKNFSNLEKAIPEKHRRLFPQLAVDASWPPTLLMHGTADTAVLPEESYHFHALVVAAKVRAVLLEIPDVDHLFDFAPDAEEKWGTQFDLTRDFISDCLQINGGSA
ncbi:alpha/beta-hydrolase [Pholiota molesta]|nr:alpha/beta-hydrolase [Pholiota molesta]